MTYITRKEAIKIFIKEHPEFKIVDYNFIYSLGRKKQVKKESKMFRDRYKKIKRLKDKGLTLREIAIEIGDLSHEMVRLILINK